MRNSAILFLCLACMMLFMTVGCKDKKPEAEDKTLAADTVAKVDTVVVVMEDTIPEDAMDSLISAAPMPKTADELFDDFLFNFTAKDWKMERFYSKQEFYTLILDDESQLELSKDTCVDSVVIEKIDLKGKSVEQHVFNRINGEWMLTRINRNTMFQNPNKSFLAFYERFATDSLFQEESINDPVATILPDPDDDFTMVEGEFHPDQWEEFKPPVLPSEFIYNVIYGQEYRLSKQKLFVVRGMSNGLETEMTFKKVDGKWKLVKLVE